MRSISPLSGCAFAAVLVVLAAACAPPSLHVSAPAGPAAPPAAAPAPSAPAPSASASVSAAPAPAPAVRPRAIQEPPPPAWTDAEAVAHLAKDCTWAPVEKDNPSGLSCEIHPEQACNYNECYDLRDQCLPRCTATCDGCAGGCVKGCATCKRACKDDACRSACATHCGECRQTCLKANDHCASGVCGTQVEACGKKLFADWKASGCEKFVPKLRACVEACADDLTRQTKEDVPYSELVRCQDGCEGSEAPGCDQFHSYLRIY